MPSVGSAANWAAIPRQDVVLRETGIIVEEEQQISFDQAHSGIATGGNAQILRAEVLP
jgi:hypothetical protein